MADAARLRALGVRVIAGDLAEEGRMVRHSPEALAEVLTTLVAESAARRTRSLAAD